MLKRFCDIDEKEIHEGEQFYSIILEIAVKGDHAIRIQPREDFQYGLKRQWASIPLQRLMVCRQCAMKISGSIQFDMIPSEDKDEAK